MNTKPLLASVLLLIAACQHMTAPTDQPSGSEITSSELTGSHWQLISIQSMDDQLYTPKSKQHFTLRFNAENQLQVQSDCNRGFGSWTSARAGQLLIGPIALTRMACPPDSLDGRFNQDLSYVRSYVMQDGHLFLATMADGAILKFERFDNP